MKRAACQSYKCDLCGYEEAKLLYKKEPKRQIAQLVKRFQDSTFSDEQKRDKIARLGFFSNGYHIVGCKRCDLVYRHPILTRRQLKEFYDIFAYGHEIITQERERPNVTILLEGKVRAIKHFRETGKLLDIGCAAGDFLMVAKNDFDVYGLEVSPETYAYVKGKLGLRVFHGGLKDVHFPDRYFDVINMTEVIEHLPSPRAALIEANRILKEHGIIVIKTANIDSLPAFLARANFRYYVIEHLFYFSRRTLTQMLKKAGFSILKVCSHDDIPLITQLKAYRMSCQKVTDYLSFAIILFKFILSKFALGRVSIVSTMNVYAEKKEVVSDEQAM